MLGGEDISIFMPTHALLQGRKEILNGGAQGGSHPLYRGSVAPPALLPAAGQRMKPLLWKTWATRAQVYGHVYTQACTFNYIYEYIYTLHIYPRVSWCSMNYLLQTRQ